MKLLDLFAGIGGFSLAAHWMGWETVAFVEKDEFCQKVLRKNFGENIEIHNDITKFSGKPFRGRVDIVTGGFPCQPFSASGLKKGASDERALWREMFRVIEEARPAWIIGENVTGIIPMELDNVLADLEGAGYETQAVIIPACATGAEHRRDRLWIIGNAEGRGFLPQPVHDRASSQIDVSKRIEFVSQVSLFEIWNRPDAGTDGESDGLPDKLDKPERKPDARYEPRTDSEFRIKALGNSIVPQVAYEIFKAIEASERTSESEKLVT